MQLETFFKEQELEPHWIDPISGFEKWDNASVRYSIKAGGHTVSGEGAIFVRRRPDGKISVFIFSTSLNPNLSKDVSFVLKKITIPEQLAKLIKPDTECPEKFSLIFPS